MFKEKVFFGSKYQAWKEIGYKGFNIKLKSLSLKPISVDEFEKYASYEEKRKNVTLFNEKQYGVDIIFLLEGYVKGYDKGNEGNLLYLKTAGDIIVPCCPVIQAGLMLQVASNHLSYIRINRKIWNEKEYATFVEKIMETELEFYKQSVSLHHLQATDRVKVFEKMFLSSVTSIHNRDISAFISVAKETYSRIINGGYNKKKDNNHFFLEK